ncbi:MAG: abortive infection family protein [Gammaproteobacteria bacterium]
MSDLNGKEKRKLEKCFRMEGGYVLDFSDRTFREFFEEHTNINIDAEIYRSDGDSKAKRLRRFWALEENHVVGMVVEAMIQHGQETSCFLEEEGLVKECLNIAIRLSRDIPVVALNSLTGIVGEHEFRTLMQHLHEAIQNNQPEAVLDRLHTFVTKYIRILCNKHGIEASREKPLHSIFGEYVKCLRAGGYLESKMTDLILKSNITVLAEFNHVRNNKSLAHDNSILNHEESLLIVKHVMGLLHFIEALEKKFKSAPM